MSIQAKDWAAGLLGISGIALSILVPGGPIETRSFSHINSITLGAFNTFLTTLVLGSLLLVYFVLKSERGAILAAAICGLSFLGVYGLDLARIFPVSPDAMPPALLGVEVFGTIISIPLMVLSMQAFRESGLQKRATTLQVSTIYMHDVRALQVFAVIAVGTIALGIIAFATRSAMGL